jgi:CRISPR-associated protein Csm2
MARTNLDEVQDLAIISAEDINSIGDNCGSKFKEKVKTSQIRNVYGAINGIRAEYHKENKYNERIHRQLVLLKPKLAYAAGRHRDIRPFHGFMVQAIDGVVTSKKPEEALRNFFALIEAVVAYHKFHGGTD